MRNIVTYTSSYTIYFDVWTRYYLPYFDTVVFRVIPFDGINDFLGIVDKWNIEQPYFLRDCKILGVADMDTLLVANPDKYRDLSDYMDKMGDFARATGYHVIQMDEPPLDLTKPIMQQRKYWVRDVLYDVVSLIKRPLAYKTFHQTLEGVNPDPDLVLIHLRDADIELSKKAAEFLKREYSMKDLEERKKRVVEIPDKWKFV